MKDISNPFQWLVDNPSCSVFDMRVYHRKGDGLVFECQPEPRKNSGFPKWFCYVCRRYVLPDGKYHFSSVVSEKKEDLG